MRRGKRPWKFYGKKGLKRASEKTISDAGSGKDKGKKDLGKQKTNLYPSLSELEESDTPTNSETDSDDEMEEDPYVTPLESVRKSIARLKFKKEREKRNSRQSETKRTVIPLGSSSISRSYGSRRWSLF